MNAILLILLGIATGGIGAVIYFIWVMTGGFKNLGGPLG